MENAVTKWVKLKWRYVTYMYLFSCYISFRKICKYTVTLDVNVFLWGT